MFNRCYIHSVVAVGLSYVDCTPYTVNVERVHNTTYLGQQKVDFNIFY